MLPVVVLCSVRERSGETRFPPVRGRDPSNVADAPGASPQTLAGDGWQSRAVVYFCTPPHLGGNF